MSAMMSNTEILRMWYTQVWENGDIDAIDRIMRPSTEAKGLLTDMAVSAQDMKNFIEMLRDTMRDIKVNILMVVEQGDWLAAVVEHRALTGDTLKPLHATGHVMIRFEEGMMVEAYNCFDFLSFFEQQDQLPPNAMALLLTGASLA